MTSLSRTSNIALVNAVFLKHLIWKILTHPSTPLYFFFILGASYISMISHYSPFVIIIVIALSKCAAATFLPGTRDEDLPLPNSPPSTIISWTDFVDMNLSSALVKLAPMIVSLSPHWSSILPNCLLHVNNVFNIKGDQDPTLEHNFFNSRLECGNDNDFTCLGSYLENKTTSSSVFFLDELWGSSSTKGKCPRGHDLLEFHEMLAKNILGINRSVVLDASYYNIEVRGGGGGLLMDIPTILFYSIFKQVPSLKSYYSLFG